MDDVRQYLKPSYWFKQEAHYEWFKDYSHFRNLVHSYINPSSEILELGCGNSRMSEQMYADGFVQITSTDLSPVAVAKKQENCSALGYNGIKICVADALNLPFEEGSFDIVIEKGVMDALLVDSGNPWDPKSEAKERVNTMLKQVHRVLSSAGIFISIAFGQPHFRRAFFEIHDFEWSMKYFTFGESFHYYFYVLQKGSKISQNHFCEDHHHELKFKDLVQENMEDEDYLLRSLIEDD